MDQIAPQTIAGLGVSHGPPVAVALLTTVQRFEKGAVLSHPSFGDTLISGAILTKWDAAHAMSDAFGFSVQDIIGAALDEAFAIKQPGRSGQAQYFERGMIVTRSDGGTFIVYGDIYGRYRQLGDVSGSLGWPKADEGGVANGGRVSAFDGGSIFWSAATGPKIVQGNILACYAGLGGAGSFLGLPTSDEQPVLTIVKQGGILGLLHKEPSQSVEIGRCSLFTGGGIWWTSARGAFAVPNDVLAYWRQHGGPTGLFGFPTNSLLAVGGNRLMEFEKGLVAITPTGPLPFFELEVFIGQFESNFDDIHVEIDVAFDDPSRHQHYWVPTNGYSSNPINNQNWPAGLVRLGTSITVTVSGYGDHSFGDDERLGTLKKVYDASNLWGIPYQQSGQPTAYPANENVNGKFHFTTTLSVKGMQAIPDSASFRTTRWWPFHNFDTPFLSQHQMAQTFSDVSEDESNVWHPFDNAFYKYVYQTSGKKGTCFGMCLEAIYARFDHSVFAEPIFDNPLIGYPATLASGTALDKDPNQAETTRFAEPCQIKFGYQLGHPMVDYALGQYVSGHMHDPVAVFHDSQEAYDRGDYPLLSVTSGGIGSPGHVVVPYGWDNRTKPWRIKVANPNAPASLKAVADDDNAQNVVFIDPDKNSYTFQIGPTETYQGGKPGPGMIMSVPFHLLSSEPSTPFWEVAAALAAGTLLLLIFAGDDGETAQISNGHGATAFHPQPGQPAYNLDAATRLPNFAPVLLFSPPADGQHVETYRIVHPVPFRKAGDKAPAADVPAASLAHSHVIAAKGPYQWGLKGPGGSTMLSVSGGASSDTISITQIGRPEQSVALQTATAKTATITVCGGRPDAAGLRLFELSGVPVGPSHTMTTHLEEAGEHLVVQNTGGDATIGLRVQSGPLAAQSVSKTTVIPAGSVVRIHPDTWANAAITKSAVNVEVLQAIGGPVVRTLKL